MASCTTSLVMVVSIFSVTLGQNSGPLAPYTIFRTHVEDAVAQCGENQTMVVIALGCWLNKLTSEGRPEPETKEATFNLVEEFVDCMEPYKEMLEGCQAASVDDLAALDLVKLLSKNKGALFNELAGKFVATSVPPPVDCSSEDVGRMITIFEGCKDELGISALSTQVMGNGFALLGNLCRWGSGLRTCINRVKTTSIGTTCESYDSGVADIYLDAFRKVEAESENPDIISECFAFRTV